MAEEKQFAASEKKLKKAREEGKVPRGRICSASIATGLILLVISSFARSLWLLAEEGTRTVLSSLVTRDPSSFVGMALLVASGITAAILVLAIPFAVAAELLQVGFGITTKILIPKFDKLNPAQGATKTLKAVKQWPIFLGGVTVLIAVAALILYNKLSSAAVLFSPASATAWMVILYLPILRLAGVALLVVGVANGIYARHRFKKEMTMDFSEVKQEAKDESGDPHLRAARDSEHRRMMAQNIRDRVKKAKVVVIN